MGRKSCRRVTGEVAVMDVSVMGVTTRARALATASATNDSASGQAKRRKTGMMNQAVRRFRESSTCRQVGCYADRGLASENSTSRPPTEENSSRCLNPSSNEEVSVSCCSSYGSSLAEKDNLKFADLEDQDESAEVDASTSQFRTERRVNTSSSAVGEEISGMDSVASEFMVLVNTPPPLSKDEFQLLSDSDGVDLFPEIDEQTEIVKPTEAEIEDFFTLVEAQNHRQLEDFKKRFKILPNQTDNSAFYRYNFDFVKEEPLEGRYEWRQRT